RSWKPHVALAGRHKAITALAFSPDSKFLVSGDIEGKVLFWDVTTLEVTEPVVLRPSAGPFPDPGGKATGPTDMVLFAQFSPDGNLVAVGGGDGAVGVGEMEPVRQALVARKRAAPPPAVREGTPRLALVGTERGPAIQNILTLTEARLSAGPEVRLVERRKL